MIHGEKEVLVINEYRDRIAEALLVTAKRFLKYAIFLKVKGANKVDDKSEGYFSYLQY